MVDRPPNLDANPVNLGQCVVYMNIAQEASVNGTTPQEDIGAIGIVEIMANTEVLKQKQGWPLVKTNEWIKEQTLEFSIIGQEDSLAHDEYQMGGSTTAETYFHFGGQTDRPVVSVRIIKTLSDRTRKIYDIWRARPAGTPKQVFDPENQNMYEYFFEGEYSAVDWINADTTETEETLMRISRAAAE